MNTCWWDESSNGYCDLHLCQQAINGVINNIAFSKLQKFLTTSCTEGYPESAPLKNIEHGLAPFCRESALLWTQAHQHLTANAMLVSYLCKRLLKFQYLHMTSHLFEELGALFKLRPTGSISQHMQCGADHQVMQDIAGIQVPCMDSPTCTERERERERECSVHTSNSGSSSSLHMQQCGLICKKLFDSSTPDDSPTSNDVC